MTLAEDGSGKWEIGGEVPAVFHGSCAMVRSTCTPVDGAVVEGVIEGRECPPGTCRGSARLVFVRGKIAFSSGLAAAPDRSGS